MQPVMNIQIFVTIYWKQQLILIYDIQLISIYVIQLTLNVNDSQ